MAIVSFSRKFIFIKTRKTAGTSIQKSLVKFCDENDIVTYGRRNLINKKECVIEEFASLEDIEDKFKVDTKDYFKFGFTRNPFSIVLSRYLFHMKRKHLLGEANKKGFNSWVKAKYFGGRPTVRDGDRSRLLLFDQSFIPTVDFIGKVENIGEDFNKVVKRIGLEDVKLAWVNKSNVKGIEYREWMSGPNKKRVEDFFDFELDYFKYKF